MNRGITIDNIYDPKLHQHLSWLSGRPTVRVVVDASDNEGLADYEKAVAKLHEKADIMIQIQDSFNEKSFSIEETVEKKDKLRKRFPFAKYWEIGNEVNGDWCSPWIIEKVKALKMDDVPGTILTLFLDDRASMLSWFASSGLRADYVFVSHYPKNFAEMNDDWDLIFSELAAYDFVKGVGIGEFGFENWEGKPSMLDFEKLNSFYYGMRPNAPKFVNFGGYWDYQRHWKAMTKFWNRS